MKRIIIIPTVLVLAAAPVLAGTVSGKVNCGSKCDSTLVYLEGLQVVADEGSTAVFDQKDKVFVPHVLPVVLGTTIDITNSDPMLHNVHIYDASDDTVLNLAMPFQGQVASHDFEKPGAYAVRCDAHPEMSAYIVVLENGFFAMVDSTGSFTIQDVPAGSYTLVGLTTESGEAVREAIDVSAGSPTTVDF